MKAIPKLGRIAIRLGSPLMDIVLSLEEQDAENNF